jgi:hypothetical protein
MIQLTLKGLYKILRSLNSERVVGEGSGVKRGSTEPSLLK